MLSEIARRRLNLVIQALQEVPEEAFDLGTWKEKIVPEGASMSCSFTACAVGWYIEKFPEEGLEFQKLENNPIYDVIWAGDRGVWAVAKHFDLPRMDVVRLFTTDGYDFWDVRPQEVIDEIKSFIADNSL